MAKPYLLVGDIGGTNARFAIADTNGPGFSREKVVSCVDFESAGQAIRSYLNDVDVEQPAVICIAAAGAVKDETVCVTNNHWSIDVESLRREFDSSAIKLLNDFEAIAYSIPLLTDADLVQIGSHARSELTAANYTVGVIGPGTGFGAAGLLSRDRKLIPIVGEQGHVGFAPGTEFQGQVSAVLAERFGRVSNERILSGPGIENIHWAVCRIRDQDRPQISAADIFASYTDENDPMAGETVQIFFEALGQAAGDLALTLGAAEGIYIAGGIVPRYPDLLQKSHFRRGFERKGRQKELMENIPTQLVMYPQPGLLGAGFCALEMFAS